MTKLCIQCGEYKTVSCTEEQFKRWQDGELIQKAMPNVPAGERELLISGYCGTCFDAMFAEDEDE